jgi:hypothetical protein
MNRKSFGVGIIVVLVLLLAALLVFNFGSPDKQWPERIRSGTKFSITRLISVHESPVHILTIDGKRFEHVRGFKPFYLRVPESDLIVFATDDRDYKTVYHVFNMDTDEDIAVRPLSVPVFGNTIGFSGGNRSDSVEKTNDGQVILCTDITNAASTLPSLSSLCEIKGLVSIDLAKKALVADKTFYYDKDGKILDERDEMVP